MQVSIETTSKLERRLTVGVPAETVDGQVDARLREAVKNVRLPGFRPGKVPLKVMRQRFGPVSYTHLTLPTAYACTSLMSPLAIRHQVPSIY